MSINLYAVWNDVFSPGALLVGKVVSYASGVATLEMPGGSRLTARGEATVGTTVWVQDGVIQGPAPELPVESASI